MVTKLAFNQLNERLERLKMDMKRNYVIIVGLPESQKALNEREDMSATIRSLFKNLRLPEDFDYDIAFRMGQWKMGATRSIRLRFVRLRDKITFLKQKVLLKGSIVKLREDETAEQKRTRKLFSDAYNSEWTKDNTISRIIRNRNMIILKDGKPINKFYLDKKDQVMQGFRKLV